MIQNLKMVQNLIYNHNQKLKRGPRQIAQIAEPPQGGKASLKFVAICCAEESKLGDKRES